MTLGGAGRGSEPIAPGLWGHERHPVESNRFFCPDDRDHAVDGPRLFLTPARIKSTFAYTYGGLAAQVLAGVDIKLTKRLSVFTEYKLSWAGVNAPMNGGYRIHTNIITNHILAGVALSFGGN